jgi:hypothetical protein
MYKSEVCGSQRCVEHWVKVGNVQNLVCVEVSRVWRLQVCGGCKRVQVRSVEVRGV